MHMLLPVDPSPIHPGELGELLLNVDSAFHRTVSPDGRLERMAKILEPARTLVIRDTGGSSPRPASTAAT
jgi:hypothetical protein